MIMKKFVNVNLRNFNFKNYLVNKYDGFFPEWMPSNKELAVERSTIMQMTDRYKKKEEIEKWKRKRAKYNAVMREWGKLQ